MLLWQLNLLIAFTNKQVVETHADMSRITLIKIIASIIIIKSRTLRGFLVEMEYTYRSHHTDIYGIAAVYSSFNNQLMNHCF
jgi:hypothetical protein